MNSSFLVSIKNNENDKIPASKSSGTWGGVGAGPFPSVDVCVATIFWQQRQSWLASSLFGQGYSETKAEEQTAQRRSWCTVEELVTTCIIHELDLDMYFFVSKITWFARQQPQNLHCDQERLPTSESQPEDYLTSVFLTWLPLPTISHSRDRRNSCTPPPSKGLQLLSLVGVDASSRSRVLLVSRHCVMIPRLGDRSSSMVLGFEKDRVA
jgi:hypothetical protein